MPSFAIHSTPQSSFSLCSAMRCAKCKSCYAETKILAVILDLDGTLLNTEQVTKDVLKDFLLRHGKVLDRKKEDDRLGMTQKESAIAVVKDYELPLSPDQFIREITPMYQEKWAEAKALPGANRLIMHLHKHGLPFALASNSLRKNIDAKICYQQGWKECFSIILGSDQVKSGKPSPDIFLEAANRMGVDAGFCLVIEDSLVGVQAAKAAGMKVVAVPSLQTEADRYFTADSVLHSLLEFHPELWGLPPFEDWVDHALPIEPFNLQGLFRNGTLSEFADDGPSAFPDQVWGVYFGWAEVDMHEIFKVVVGIGWKHCFCTAQRKIQLCLIDGSDDLVCNQKMQLLLVGYIRGFSSEGKTMVDTEILEEDMSIANAALNLPMFAGLKHVPSFSEASLVGSAVCDDKEQG
ncbi:bifunctional riboflavin kinase/FMN phosphatase-like isoform X2 [Malania oleifera]|uniref:bifunctional riboflavin kinase/FMN phosphatase-like isoform X2 n=1 Tax=Malania oleifera TaxID=397392 RepID=UPI0025AEADAC|nr:bifunctional riboflavin kinase/FMN phosphatase-like isoform X2 [Malania oleifera]